MKTPEDEAFDDLAKRQGAWGGGFPAKRAMAADKLQEPVCDKDPQGCWNVRCQLGKQCKNLAQPAQEPVAFLAESTRFKVTLTDCDCKITGLPRELGGRWVALVDAANDCHLHLTAPPQRKPLTDEEIADLWGAQIFHVTDLKLAIDFVREIERAHGIKE